jgi:uncharacterized LabA/DUF88 family protein
VTAERLKLAVFIDFDNIEIGVKETLGREFDVSVVLEALKERGEVVTKVAYGDWPRAGEHSRQMTQHAVQMVQRNVTPRGDKNGADINLALDALEMAFTRHHINAFAIVGGDSDFIALVEKLKQYDKRVFVVGGRSFTSQILQRNCHEFIAYENLLKDKEDGEGGRTARASRAPSRSGAETKPLAAAFPYVQRALKILAEREAAPQLGALKSTLLQLDPTFSERDYGVGSFQEFMQRMQAARYVQLRRTERGYMVDLETADGDKGSGDLERRGAPAERLPSSEGGPDESSSAASLTPSADRAEAMSVLKRAMAALAEKSPGRPLYMRQVRQAVRTVDGNFDERRYGFRNTLDLLHEGQRQGMLRLQRDRKGVWRILPGSAPFAASSPGQRPVVPRAGSLDEALPEASLEAATPETRPGPLPGLDEAQAAVSEVPAPTLEEAALPEVTVPEVPLPVVEGIAPPPPARRARRPRAASASAKSRSQKRSTQRRAKKTPGA